MLQREDFLTPRIPFMRRLEKSTSVEREEIRRREIAPGAEIEEKVQGQTAFSATKEMTSLALRKEGNLVQEEKKASGGGLMGGREPGIRKAGLLDRIDLLIGWRAICGVGGRKKSRPDIRLSPPCLTGIKGRLLRRERKKGQPVATETHSLGSVPLENPRPESSQKQQSMIKGAGKGKI